MKDLLNSLLEFAQMRLLYCVVATPLMVGALSSLAFAQTSGPVPLPPIRALPTPPPKSQPTNQDTPVPGDKPTQSVVREQATSGAGDAPPSPSLDAEVAAGILQAVQAWISKSLQEQSKATGDNKSSSPPPSAQNLLEELRQFTDKEAVASLSAKAQKAQASAEAEACTTSLYDSSRSGAGASSPSGADVGTCAEALRREIKRYREGAGKEKKFSTLTAVDAPPTDLTDASDQRALVSRYHLLYKNLKVWEHRSDSKAENPQVKAVGEEIHQLMSELGLREPFGAALVTGASFADTGNDQVTTPVSSLQSQVRGVVVWESQHFLGENPRARFFDVSFGGQFGYVPALTLVEERDANGNSLGKEPQALFRQAFAWDFATRFNFHAGKHAELSAVSRYGQTVLTSDTETIKRGGSSPTYWQIRNGVGKSAPFAEFGGEARLFRNTLTAVHEDKTFVSPAFSLAAGFKVDDRFKRDGVLASYDQPRDRFFFRFMVNLTKVVMPEKEGKPQAPISVRFGVDYDMPLHDHRVPSGTRYIVSSDVDLLKILSGGK